MSRSGLIAPIFVQDQTLQRVQDNIIQKVNEMAQTPISVGVLIQSVNLSSGSNNIPHGLDKPYTGVIITKRSNGAVIYDETSDDSRRFVRLNSSGSCVIDLWVF
jgi:hypothetical protein